jgi:hypothetical protein
MCSAKNGGDQLAQALFGLVLSVCNGHIWALGNDASSHAGMTKDMPLYLPSKKQWNNLVQQIQKQQEQKVWGKAVDLLAAPKDLCHNS